MLVYRLVEKFVKPFDVVASMVLLYALSTQHSDSLALCIVADRGEKLFRVL